MRLTGSLLALSGAACLVGIVGILFKIPLLDLGSLIGGVLFLLALIPLTLAFLGIDRSSRPAVRFEATLGVG